MATIESRKDSNFYSFLNFENASSANQPIAQGESVPVMDKAPKKKKGHCYVVFCKDRDGSLRKVLNAIAKHGNIGHSFEIVVDKDDEREETFFWDGDGGDRIDAVVDAPEMSDSALAGILLNALNEIRYTASRAIEGDDGIGEQSSPADKNKALQDIVSNADLCLRGSKFNDEKHRSLDAILDNIKEYLPSIKNGGADDPKRCSRQV